MKFRVPVEWSVYDFVEVESDNFEEAIKYVIDNRDIIPLGTEPEYIDGSYKINSEDDIVGDEYDENYVKQLSELLQSYGYGKAEEEEI